MPTPIHQPNEYGSSVEFHGAQWVIPLAVHFLNNVGKETGFIFLGLQIVIKEHQLPKSPPKDALLCG